MLGQHQRTYQPVSMSQFLIFGKDHQDNALKTVLKFLNKHQARDGEGIGGAYFFLCTM